MKIQFNNSEYPAAVWHSSEGRVGACFSYDTETTAIDNPAVVQDFVLGVVFNGAMVYFIRRQDLRTFWTAHEDCKVYMHTASFDLEVTAKASGYDFASMVESGLVVDISLLYRLAGCAESGDVPERYSLDLMTREIIGVALDKNDSIRLAFGQFLESGVVDYRRMSTEFLVYAGQDSIATFFLGLHLEDQCRYFKSLFTPHLLHDANDRTAQMAATALTARWGLLGHDIQLRGDIALRQIEHYGLSVDPVTVKKLDTGLKSEIDQCRAILAKHGYIPGQPGNRAVYGKIIAEIEQQTGIKVSVTEKSKLPSQAAEDLLVLAGNEFVDAFLRAKELEKLLSTYVRHLDVPGNRVHPRYSLIKRTGRTSCSSPNIQNLPRDSGIRESFVPSAGYVFLACDYSMLELCTLAQITYSKYGESVMRDKINEGVDLHRYTAGMILNKPAGEVTRDERQKAKAANFGVPGGMGGNGLKAYARSNYGVELSVGEAEEWRSMWLDLYPEMRRYLAQDDMLEDLGNTFDLETFPGNPSTFNAEIAAMIVKRIAGGNTCTSAGRAFSQGELDWSWAQLSHSRSIRSKALQKDIAARRGSKDLQKALDSINVATIPTGRIRSNCSYTESRNWTFQALAADGAKLALYALIRAGYRVVAFIHDEVIVEVPECADYRSVAEDVSGIMISAMRQVCPDVTIKTDYAVMPRWIKGAKAMFDAHGHLIPYEQAA